MIVEPVASAESVLTADEREEGTVLVDVGGGTSDVAVFYDGAIVHTASIPVGGFHFSNDLSIALSIDFDDAEQLKLKHGTCTPELVGMTEEVRVHPSGMTEPLSITKRELGQILKERVQELFRMILLKLDEPHLEDVPLDSIVFTGGGAKLDGFLALGKYVFQRQVRLGAPRGLDGLPEENRDPSYSAAAGMCLWTMRNLPGENHVGRPSRAKVHADADQAEIVAIFPGAGTSVSSSNGNGGVLSSLRGLFGGRK
jgi:cell division protein FtsA